MVHCSFGGGGGGGDDNHVGSTPLVSTILCACAWGREKLYYFQLFHNIFQLNNIYKCLHDIIILFNSSQYPLQDGYVSERASRSE